MWVPAVHVYTLLADVNYKMHEVPLSFDSIPSLVPPLLIPTALIIIPVLWRPRRPILCRPRCPIFKIFRWGHVIVYARSFHRLQGGFVQVCQLEVSFYALSCMTFHVIRVSFYFWLLRVVLSKLILMSFWERCRLQCGA